MMLNYYICAASSLFTWRGNPVLLLRQKHLWQWWCWLFCYCVFDFAGGSWLATTVYICAIIHFTQSTLGDTEDNLRQDSLANWITGNALVSLQNKSMVGGLHWSGLGRGRILRCLCFTWMSPCYATPYFFSTKFQKCTFLAL